MLFVLLLAQSCRHILTLNQFGGHAADESKKIHLNYTDLSELDENKLKSESRDKYSLYFMIGLHK